MEFEYKLTDEDYLKFNDFNAFRTDHGKAGSKKRMILLPILLLAALGVMALNGANIKLIIVEAVLFIGGISFFTYYRRRNYQTLLLKYLIRARKQGRVFYSAEGTLTFGEEGIEDRGTLGTLKMNYDHIYAVYPNVSNLYVYESPSKAIIIPGSIYASNEEKNNAWEFLRKKIPAEKWMNGR